MLNKQMNEKDLDGIEEEVESDSDLRGTNADLFEDHDKKKGRYPDKGKIIEEAKNFK